MIGLLKIDKSRVKQPSLFIKFTQVEVLSITKAETSFLRGESGTGNRPNNNDFFAEKIVFLVILFNIIL